MIDISPVRYRVIIVFMSFKISRGKEAAILIQVECEVPLNGCECNFCLYLGVPALQNKDVSNNKCFNLVHLMFSTALHL